MSVPPKIGPGGSPGHWAAGAGATAALAGIVASSCCALPLLLAGLGLGGVSLSVLPVLAVWRPYLIGSAAVALLLAWFLYLRPLKTDGSNHACGTEAAVRQSPRWLVLASAIVLLALVWQAWIEPQLLSLLN